MKEIAGKKVILTEGEFLRREEANKRYLMKLETPYLLRSYLHEAGRYSGRGPDAEAFGGWEDLSCQLRGHFLGHWLSAAALHYQETEDVELKAKTEGRRMGMPDSGKIFVLDRKGKEHLGAAIQYS